jgi:hypothetical protein
MALVATSTPEHPTQAMPGGGHPQDDAAYIAWSGLFCHEACVRWLDMFDRDLPDRELIHTWELTSHLYRWITGWDHRPGPALNYRHRIRLVAIQYRLRPEEIITEATRYLERLKHEHGGKEAVG